jgi:hypothetical protein
MCELTTVCVLPGLRSLRHTISPLELLRGHTILEYFPTSSKSNDMKENSLFLQTQNIWTLTTVPLSLSPGLRSLRHTIRNGRTGASFTCGGLLHVHPYTGQSNH